MLLSHAHSVQRYRTAGKAACTRPRLAPVHQSSHSLSRSARLSVSTAAKKEEQEDIEISKTSSRYFPDVISNLLWNASSLITARGEASCNVCRREGYVTCPDCGGHRVITRKFTSRKAHAEAKLARLLGASEGKPGSVSGTEWRMSNRCKRCRGTGVIVCPACNGTGVRGSYEHHHEHI